jgi:predicted secreted protein
MVVSTSAGIQRGAYRPLAKVSSVVRLALVAASIFFVLVGSAAATRIVGVGGNKNGEHVRVDVGDVIVVSLRAQPPSSAYAWRVATMNRQVLRPDSSTYVAGARPSTVVGYGGVQILLFKAIRQGKSPLRLIYRKPGSPVNGTFEMDVTVSPAGA